MTDGVPVVAPMTPFRRIRMGFRIIMFLSLPFSYSWFAHRFPIPTDPFRPAPGWLPTARGAMWIVVLLCTAAPFLCEHIFMGIIAPQVRGRGRQPEEMVLGLGIVMSGLGPQIAFILYLFPGKTTDVYATSAISVVSIVFWAWRYRRVVRSVVRTS